MKQQGRFQKMPHQEPGSMKALVAGGVAGVVISTLGHPFDTIKVRMQTQAISMAAAGKSPKSVSSIGMLQCAKTTIKFEGFRGLYKGLPPTLLAATPFYATVFFGNNIGKRLQKQQPGQQLSVHQHLFAGAIAGVFATLVATPTERIKCLMQIQRESKGAAKYSSSIDCAVTLYREGGVRSIYKGALSTLLREIPLCAVYFGTYEALLRGSLTDLEVRKEFSASRTMISGGLAGTLCWLVGLPADVAKSRFQTALPGRYKHIGSVYLELIREGGLAALYKGMTPAMMRAFPANAGAFLGFEFTLKLLNRLTQLY